MKIKKFNENINNGNFYLITEINIYDDNDYTYILTHENVKNFLIYKIYEKIQQYGDNFNEFENDINFENIENLLDYYNRIEGDFTFKLSKQNIEDVEFENWMQEKLDAKKYNL